MQAGDMERTVQEEQNEVSPPEAVKWLTAAIPADTTDATKFHSLS